MIAIPPFPYAPLAHNEIRLFQLDLHELGDPLSGRIINFRHPCHDEITLTNVTGMLSNWRDMRLVEKSGDDHGYDVLSYAWGTEDKTHPLRLSLTGKVYNKKKLGADGSTKSQGYITVRHNLYTLLQQLRQNKYDRFIWIDSICIDQTNLPEKGQQIPLMRDIYKEARNVLVWLGEATQAEEGALTVIPAITRLMKENFVNELPELNLDEPESFTSIGLPEPSHSIWPAIGALMLRSWFQRLWTLQEAVLHSELSAIKVLCGGRSITWEALNAFVHTFTQQPIVNWTMTGDSRVNPSGLHGYAAIGVIDYCRKLQVGRPFGLPLSVLLPASHQRKATNAADKIFGILGMAPPGLVKTLNLNIAMPLSEVFITVARYYLRNEVDECLLNYVACRQRLPCLPSWCPNFGSLELTPSLGLTWLDGLWIKGKSNNQLYRAGFLKKTENTQPYRAGFRQDGPNSIPLSKHWLFSAVTNGFRRHDVAHGIYDSNDPRQLTVLPNPRHVRASGMVVDAVGPVIPYNDGVNEFKTSLSAIEQTVKWEKCCHNLASQTLNTADNEVPNTYWRTLIANQTYVEVGEGDDQECIVWDHLEKTDVLPRYRKWLEYMQNCSTRHEVLPSATHLPGSDRIFCNQVLRICHQRCFFATKDRRLGLGPRDMREGDLVVVFWFCPTPYVIRRKEEHEIGEAWTFVGEVYIHGLMYEQAIDMQEKNQAVERDFVLV